MFLLRPLRIFYFEELPGVVGVGTFGSNGPFYPISSGYHSCVFALESVYVCASAKSTAQVLSLYDNNLLMSESTPQYHDIHVT